VDEHREESSIEIELGSLARGWGCDAPGGEVAVLTLFAGRRRRFAVVRGTAIAADDG